jgi:preprotein translocase subunit SecD
LATSLAKAVLFRHYCLAARAEFRDGLPQSGQGVLGLFDALTLNADVASVGGDAMSADLTSLKARLFDEYQVAVPLIQWQDRKFIRVSIQGYNTPSDVDALLETLRDIL